jgi:hypothetical protein
MIITKDDDFGAWCAAPFVRPTRQLDSIRQRPPSGALRRLEVVWAQVIEALDRGERLIELI